MCVSVYYQETELETFGELKALLGESRVVINNEDGVYIDDYEDRFCLCAVDLDASAVAAGLTTYWPEHRLHVDFLGGPLRVQRRRTKGWTMPANTVSVCRPGKWGNPYKVGDLASTGFPLDIDEVLELYEYKVVKYLSGELNQLRGKNLACFCPLNQKCHADVLLRLANTDAA